MTGFTDIHSHVIPSGDDGAATHAQAVELCRRARASGTDVLYATPHVWPHEGLTRNRESMIGASFAAATVPASALGLELRLGYELTPATALLEEDPRRFALQGTSAVLVELPFSGPLVLAELLAEHVQAAGLRPILAHPERCEHIVAAPARLVAFRERGWSVQVNARSLLGAHGHDARRIAVEMLERGAVDFVASDGHDLDKPPVLDRAYAVVKSLIGQRALALFDGRNLPRASVPSS